MHLQNRGINAVTMAIVLTLYKATYSNGDNDLGHRKAGAQTSLKNQFVAVLLQTKTECPMAMLRRRSSLYLRSWSSLQVVVALSG